MWSHRNVLLSITFPLFFLLFHPQIYAKLEANSPLELAKDFCSKRRTSDDRKFCLQVLTKNPKISSAKDNSILLKIAVDAADENAKKTHDYMKTMFESKMINQTIKPVLKECITMYEVVIYELEAIERDLRFGPYGKAEARIALAEVKGCQKLIETNKICDSSISNRNKIAEDFGELVQDIANLF
ncbi:hypothetical protein M9H77_31739 [Catharanthus roseus]|uniref:Uncharacterized protein n=1 Tax=Catharanthus roseus TaxID=4058 RepID=A0ACC0A0Z2_CATRO|nr:hypothetical protein M9H77_31739 [Catharanthus roseus]